MSYSRWSTSTWYSFYSCWSGPTRDEQVLSLWSSMDGTKDWCYSELKAAKESGLDEFLKENYPDLKDNQADLNEAKEIIDIFLKDVDDQTDEELQSGYDDLMKSYHKIDTLINGDGNEDNSGEESK